jgi:hypothetical protein
MLPSPHALGRPPHFDAQIARQILSQCDAPLTRHPQETGLKAIFAVFYRSHFQTDQAAADHYGIPRQRFAEWKPAIEPLRNDADLSATLGGVQHVPGDLHVQGTVYAQGFERLGGSQPGISPPVSFPPSPPASVDLDASNLPPEIANIIQANIHVPPTSPKFYFAVKGGPSPGVYNSWPEALAHGAQGAPCVSQKKFTTPYEAEAFVAGAIIIKAPVLKGGLHFDHDWSDPPSAEIERRHKAQNAIRKHEGSFNIASAQGNMKCSIVIKSDMSDEVWFISSPAEMHEVEQPSWFIEASFSGASPSTPISIDVKIIDANQKQSILVRDFITLQDGHAISVPLSDGLNYDPDTFILEVNISRPNANLPTFTI